MWVIPQWVLKKFVYSVNETKLVWLQLKGLPLLESVPNFLSMGEVLGDQGFDELIQNQSQEPPAPRNDESIIGSDLSLQCHLGTPSDEDLQRSGGPLRLTQFQEVYMKLVDVGRLEKLCPNIQHLNLSGGNPTRCREVRVRLC